MQFVVITDDLSRDQGGYHKLPDLIGPFPSKPAARQFMEGLGPLWGSYDIGMLWGAEHIPEWDADEERRIATLYPDMKPLAEQQKN